MSKSIQVPVTLVAFAALACGGSSTPPSSPKHSLTTGQTHTATVTHAAESASTKLACYKGTGTPSPMCNLRLYEVMVEAFADGDHTIGYGTGYGPSQHNGDLKGIIASLPYIHSLGVNAIWITPIFNSIATPGGDARLDATGYFCSDYFNIDPHFGTFTDAKNLVDGAHALGMYVFFDGVFGHHKSNLVQSPMGRLPVDSDGINVDWAGSEAEALAFYTEVATYWINALKIDGWRLDQAYQVPVADWQQLRAAIEDASANAGTYMLGSTPAAPLGYMVAEDLNGSSHIASHIYQDQSHTPVLDSAFDFPMRYRVVQTLATQENVAEDNAMYAPASRLREGYDDILGLNGYPANAMPNLMITNHDLVRFGDLLQRANLAGPDDDNYWSLHKAAFAFMASYSGPITIYYGDEVGQEVPGFAAKVTGDCAPVGLCDDHVSRTNGIVPGVTVDALDAQQSDLKDYVAALMNLREMHPALHAGSRTHVYDDNNLYIDRKDADSDHVLFVLNVFGDPATVTLNASVVGNATTLTDGMTDASIQAQSGTFEIDVPGLTGRFLFFSP
jgi:glycosidase